MTFPQAFITNIAIFFYISSERPAFQNSTRDWRLDVAKWKNLSASKKTTWINHASDWLDTWSTKNPDSVAFVIENWRDVNYNNIPE